MSVEHDLSQWRRATRAGEPLATFRSRLGSVIAQDRAAWTERREVGVGVRVVDALHLENTPYYRGVWQARLARPAR